MAIKPLFDVVNRAEPMTTSTLDAYKIGDMDTRPWGGYVVTDVRIDDANGDEVVEKIITVNPGRMLSLQAHEGRAEVWTAQEGVLCALVDGKAVDVPQGKSVNIPKGAIHAMINRGNTPIKVHETQRGVCREEDNTRYFDQDGRAVVASDDPRVTSSIVTYRKIMAELPAPSTLVAKRG